jgi:hypothetical protein
MSCGVAMFSRPCEETQAKHDWSLLYWVWDKQRVMASIKARRVFFFIFWLTETPIAEIMNKYIYI